MPFRLLLIEDQPLAPGESVRSHLAPGDGFLCRRQTWSSLQPDDLPAATEDIVLLARFNDPRQPLRVFEYLRSRRIDKPVLAVLAQNAGDEVSRTAMEAVDDFVLSPVRKDELHCRLKRVLDRASNNNSEEVLARQKLKQEFGLRQLVGRDAAFTSVVKSLP